MDVPFHAHRLNLALFVDRQDDRVDGRIEVESDDVAQFLDEAPIIGKLELAHPDQTGAEACGTKIDVERNWAQYTPRLLLEWATGRMR